MNRQNGRAEDKGISDRKWIDSLIKIFSWEESGHGPTLSGWKMA